MRSFQDPLTALIVDGGRHDDNPGRSLRFEAGDLKQGVDRIIRENSAQELRADFGESDQMRPYHMGKETGALRGQAEDMKPMRELVRMSQSLAVFPIVVDRMIVAGHGLKRRKMRVCDRSGRKRVLLAELQLRKATDWKQRPA